MINKTKSHQKSSRKKSFGGKRRKGKQTFTKFSIVTPIIVKILVFTVDQVFRRQQIYFTTHKFLLEILSFSMWFILIDKAIISKFNLHTG